MSEPQPVGELRYDFAPDTWADDDDVIGAGGDLEPSTVIGAYRLGAFPMGIDGQLHWWSPLERGVLRPGGIKVSRSLRKAARGFSVTVDTAFAEVIDACADPARPGAWIDADIRAAYVRLHEMGWAHSVETRDAHGQLVGGLYGLAIGRLFAGESMFHRATDASKVALMHLAERVGAADGWIDVQWSTPHLASLGVETMPRAEYRRLAAELVQSRDVAFFP